MQQAHGVQGAALVGGSGGKSLGAAHVRRALVLAGLAALTLIALGALVRGGNPAPAPIHESPGSSSTDIRGKLPLSFVPNRGQADSHVRYHTYGAGFSAFFSEEKVTFAFIEGKRGYALELHFLGANPSPQLEAQRLGNGKVHYLTGSEHHTNLPTYQQLTFKDLWPGIDMAFRGSGGRLKYEFRLRPGANPHDIRLAYVGADLSLSGAGDLLVRTPLGTMTDTRPRSYQQAGGRKVPVDGRFSVSRSGRSYGFEIGRYDTRRPLVIDPGLAYSTFLGGGSADQGSAIAVDGAGSAYVTGLAVSADFPTSAGAFDTTHNGGSFDAIVIKLNASGSELEYATFLGGSADDYGQGIGIDGSGHIYVGGFTGSNDFPTTAQAYDRSYNGSRDVFIAKLSQSGSALEYSTYLGGSGTENDLGIGNFTVDSQGYAYATGLTGSSDFPATAGADDATFNGGEDAYVARLDVSGSALVYSTFLGGADFDRGYGVATDGSGSAYVTGLTTSADFPTTAGAYDTTLGGLGDAFVTKLSPSGSTLAYSTYLGGDEGPRCFTDHGEAIAVDHQGSAYVTGLTDQADFPTTVGAYDTALGGFGDAFVTKLNPAGSALAYSTFLGGSGCEQENGRGIAVDDQGRAYVAGETDSADFPTTAGAFDASFNGQYDDAFLSKLNPSGSDLAYSSYLGGTTVDRGRGVAIDGRGHAHVTGFTLSADFPTSAGAYDTTHNGSNDVFVTKLQTVGPPVTLVLSPGTATNTVDDKHCVTATSHDATGTPTPDITVRFSVTGSVNTSGSQTTHSNGQATFCYTGPALPGSDAISAYADTNNSSTQDLGEPSDTATKTWTLPTNVTPCVITITNGGWIVTDDLDRANFGGNAKETASGADSGQENYLDHGPAEPMDVHSLNVLAITCDSSLTQATIFGQATIDGAGSHTYRIDVQDNGEPGKGTDRYRIRLDNGYDSGDHVLRGGNVQIH
jgi:hypothetical protein